MEAGKLPSRLGTVLASVRDQIALLTETPGLDTQVLLAHVCRKDRSWLLAHPEHVLSPEEADQLDKDLRLLKNGTPLPYILGEWEFFGLRFKITPDVLIPRPETELLVETAIDWLRTHPQMRSAAEAGTGSGCIAVSLAAAVPDLQITATEISPQAASIAQSNTAHHRLENRVTVVTDNLLTNQLGQFDLIVANLPYIPTETLHKLAVYNREPAVALDGGPKGLALIEALIAQAVSRLAAQGLILLEIESSQGNSAPTLAQRYFPRSEISILTDLSGHPRLLAVQT